MSIQKNNGRLNRSVLVGKWSPLLAVKITLISEIVECLVRVVPSTKLLFATGEC